MRLRHAITSLAAIAAGLAAAPPPEQAAAVGCKTFPAAGSARQLVEVTAPSRSSTHATLTFWERSGACWAARLGPWPARVGRNGVSASRREGDGTTPLGTFRLGPTVYGVRPDPGVRLRYHRLVCGDWWDGDSRSPTYNGFRHVACGAPTPFSRGEPLWRYTTAYAHFATIEFNTRPTVPGRGSAIFLHASTGPATAGCVSIARQRLVRLLRALRPSPRPLIEIDVAST